MRARRSPLSTLGTTTRGDWVVAGVSVAGDALLFFSPDPAFALSDWDPGRITAVGVDLVWALLALPWLLVRRARPGLCLIAVSTLSVLGSLLLTCRPTLTVLLAVASAFAHHRVGARESHRAPGVQVGLGAAGLAWLGWVVSEVRNGEQGTTVGVWVLIAATYSLLLVGAAALGQWQGRGRRREDALTAQAHRAVEDERVRLARELHDLVAHSMTVMTLQSAGARAMMERDTMRAAQALEAVEATGARAVEELRRMLRAMRQQQPGLDRLDELVENARASGREVVVTHHGTERPAPHEVGLVGYRLVQEAITNALKHSGPGPLRIFVTWSEESVDLAVVSPAPSPGHRVPIPSTGMGLRGLAERVELVGGSLRAGPEEGAGWHLAATLPLLPLPLVPLPLRPP